LRINQTEADWLGYSREELIGRRISDFFDQADAETFAAQFARFKRDGYIKNIPVKIFRKDGQPIFVLLSAVAVYAADGNYIMNRAAMLDVTERVRAETDLHNSEMRFRHLFERAPIGIVLVGNGSKILIANPAFRKMFGYTQEALSQLMIADLICPVADRAETISLSDELSTYSVDKKLMRRGGASFWGRIISTGIIDQDSNAPYSLKIIEDISSHIEQETMRLEEIKEQRDVLVREIHHRIKNNLQGVVGLLRQHAFDHPEMAEVIDVTVGRIYSIAIIHGLQAESVSEEIELDQLTKSVINAAGSKIEYKNNLPYPVFIIREESVPLALVLNELITNACKHRIPLSMVNVSIERNSDKTVISITNQFNPARNKESAGGHGLSLVKSMLPRQVADLLLTSNAGVFSVVLTLFPTATITGSEQT
jgi:PAS domain S-box-containing protein